MYLSTSKYSTDAIPSWEVSRCSINEKLLSVQTRHPLVRLLNHHNPVHTIWFYFHKINISNIFSHTLGLPNSPFPSGFPRQQPACIRHLSIRAKRFYQLILLDLITGIIFREINVLWGSSIWNLLKSSIIPSLLDTNIFLSTLSSNNLIQRYSLGVGDEIKHLCRNSVAFSPQAKYADWGTATGRRILVPTLRIEGRRMVSAGEPTLPSISVF
jgi:hypothetical protein